MSNAFTVDRVVMFGGSVGKSFKKVFGTLIIDTTATGGATAGDLPATLFGLAEIQDVGHIINDNNTKVYYGLPSYDKTSMMVSGGSSNAPGDLPNDTYLMSITGF